MKIIFLGLLLISFTFAQSSSQIVIVIVDYDFGRPVLGKLWLEWCLADIVEVDKENEIARNVGNRGQCIDKTDTVEFNEIDLIGYIGSKRIALKSGGNYQVCLLAEDLPGMAGLYINCETIKGAKDMRIAFPNEKMLAWLPEPNLIPACLFNALSFLPKTDQLPSDSDNRVEEILKSWEFQDTPYNISEADQRLDEISKSWGVENNLIANSGSPANDKEANPKDSLEGGETGMTLESLLHIMEKVGLMQGNRKVTNTFQKDFEYRAS